MGQDAAHPGTRRGGGTDRKSVHVCKRGRLACGCRGEQGPAAASDAAARAALGGQNVKGKGRVTTCPPPVALLVQPAAIVLSINTVHVLVAGCRAGASRSVPYMYNNTDNRHPVPPSSLLSPGRVELAWLILFPLSLSLLLPSLTDIQSLHRQQAQSICPKPPTRTTSVHTRINLHFGVAESGYLAATRHDIHCAHPWTQLDLFEKPERRTPPQHMLDSFPASQPALPPPPVSTAPSHPSSPPSPTYRQFHRDRHRISTNPFFPRSHGLPTASPTTEV